MDFDDARRFALSLPGTTEEPHFEKLSWRVNRKIYATVPLERDRLHIFVDELEIRAAVEEHPAAFEELWWGKKLAGVRVVLANAPQALVNELLESSWSERAPASAKGKGK